MRKMLYAVLAVALVSDAAAGSDSATFRGLSFSRSVREQIEECRKEVVGKAPRTRETYPTNKKSYSQSCWERHVFCTFRGLDVTSPVSCEDPWLVVFVDAVGALPSVALVKESEGKLQALEFGESEQIQVATLLAQAAETPASTAAMLATRRFNDGRMERLPRDQLLALAQTADDREADKLFARIVELYVKAVGANLAFSVAQASEAAILFRAKYGKPSYSKEEPWQSKGGVTAKSTVQTWAWKGLKIHMRAPDRSVDNASLLVATSAYVERLLEQRRESLQKGLDDL